MPDSSTLTPADAGCLAHEEGVDRGRVADRLVEDVDHPWKEVDDVRRDLDLVQRDAELLSHLARVHHVVGHGLEALVLLAEADRVGVHLRIRPFCEDRDDARIESAAQEARHTGHRLRGER